MRGGYLIKKRNIIAITILLGVVVLSLGIPTLNVRADDRSYYISHYGMEIDIMPNGDAHVRERLTYNFEGNFNGILRDIDTDRTDGIADLRVYVDDDGTLREFEESIDEGIDVYEVISEGSLEKLKIYEQSEYEEKTFVYEYTLLNVAERYKDIGIFNRKVIDRNWDVPLMDIEILIRIPEGAKKEDLRVFAHGPLIGVSEIVDERTFSFQIAEIMPGEFVETLTIFPPDLIPDSGRVYDEVKLKSILTHEQQLADEANALREQAREEMRRQEEEERRRLEKEQRLKKIGDRLTPAFIAGIIGGIYSLIAFLMKYSREDKPQFQGDYYRELPGDYTPAIMTYLLTKGSVNSEDIMATIMDLVRKKKITINRVTREKGTFFKRTQETYRLDIVEGADIDDLLPHEVHLINWFLYKLGDNGSLVLDDIKPQLKKRYKALEFQGDHDKFKSLVKRQGEKQGFFTANNLSGSGIYALIGLILSLGGIFGGIKFRAPIGIGAGILGIVLLVSMLIIAGMRKRTRYGLEQTAMWKAFKRFLLHFSNMDRAEIPSIVIWEHYLVYAISLGVAKEVIDQLPKVFSEAELMDPSLTYMGGYRSFSHLMLMNSMLSTTTNSINNAIHTASVAASPSSSGSGGGGGFSGGSSGGGGGGGGGGAF